MWNAEKENTEISKIYPVKETTYGSGYVVFDKENKILSFVPKDAVIDIEMEPLP